LSQLQTIRLGGCCRRLAGQGANNKGRDVPSPAPGWRSAAPWLWLVARPPFGGKNHSKTYIFGLWLTIVIVSAAASSIGAAAFGNAPPQIIAAVNAVAAGALLTMVVNTMIPEAVKGEQNLTGSLVVLGLLVAFSLSNFSGG